MAGDLWPVDERALTRPAWGRKKEPMDDLRLDGLRCLDPHCPGMLRVFGRADEERYSNLVCELCDRVFNVRYEELQQMEYDEAHRKSWRDRAPAF